MRVRALSEKRRKDASARAASHLMLALQRVEQQNINLGAIEGAVARVQLPRAARGVKRARELSLRFVPRRNFS